MKQLVASVVAGVVAGAAVPAYANPHSGVDAALFRPAVDTSGVFSLEGARLMPKRDLSWKLWFGFAQAPFEAPVPGIGGPGDTAEDVVLDNVITIDIAFGMSLTRKLGIGLGVAAYRTNTGEGYGVRGRYSSGGSTASTGLISLRELSNFDPSGGFEPQSLSGPLDVRLVAKYALTTGKNLAVSLMGAAGVPFGEDEVFLGDSGFVIEPRLLIDYRLNQVKSTKFVFNVGAKLRKRTVLEAYDPFDPDAGTPEMATVVADIGSEATAGAGMIYELGQSLNLGVEAVAFVPLPSKLSLGKCRRWDDRKCGTIDDEEYFAGGGPGDLAAYAMGGFGYRASPHLMVNVMGGLGLVGMRGDDFRVSGGLTWSPQPRGVAELGRGDRDGDGLPDVSDSCMEDSEDKDGYQDDDGCPDVDNDGDGVVDANDTCPDEPEDRDAYQDDDGCPERDNDGDGISDVADRCPDGKEDKDDFEDDDGCLDEDNDGDGIVDDKDQCPNDAETVNNVDDTDGCPDTKVQTGPEETDRGINLKGALIEFTGKSSSTLTNASKTILNQVAKLIINNGLRIRVEVHVPLGTRSSSKAAIKKQQRKDKDLAEDRANAILDYLTSQGVSIQNLQAVGLGSERPLSGTVATDPLNERVDFVKTQQRNP